MTHLLKVMVGGAELSTPCSPLGAGVQLQGVLDELLFYGGALGATLSADSVRLDVWAPTAQQACPKSQEHPAPVHA